MKSLKGFQQQLELEGKSENTIKMYSQNIKMFFKFINKDQENVNQEDITKFQLSIKDLKSNTRNQKATSVRRYFQYLEDIEVIIKSPTKLLKNVTVGDNKKKVFMEDIQLDEILNYTKPDGIKLAIIIGAFVGCRISETCNIKIENINFKNKTITLFDTKTDKSSEGRVVAVDDITLKDIKSYMEKYDIVSGNLLKGEKGGDLKPQNLSKQFKVIVDMLGYSLSYHDLRARSATKLASVSVYAAQQQLGHKSIKTTEIYLRKDISKQLEIINSVR